MRAERWQKIDQIFQAALDQKPEERDAFLEQACAGDEELRREVAGLLAANVKAQSFIETPPVEMAALLRAAIEPESLAGKSISHYRVLSLLGRGGMGEVYLAEDTKLERKVAIKVLSTEIPEGARRLRREAQAAAALDHPHIAAIYEVGEEQGHSFIVMQYVKGETLAARMSRGLLKLEEALSFAVQVADALAEAHARGIIHRDIKPANIIVDARGQAKVLDFGLARRMRPPAGVNDLAESDGSLSLPSLIAGTPAYMSPEQARGEELDARTDLFSFGVMLYEMISGAHPFERGSSAETAAAIQLLEPPPLSERSSQVLPELEKVVGRALTKARDERYQTANDLLEDLRRIRERVINGARPESARKNRAVARPVRPRGWVAAFAASLMVGVVGMGIFLLRPTVPSPKVLKSTWLTKDGFYKDALVTDGARLYYRSVTNGTFSTYQIGLAGGDAVPVPINQTISNPLITNILTSRSEALVMSSSDTTEGPLWIASLPDGAARRLGNLQGKGPIWSADGRQIVYCNGNDLYTTDPDGANAHKIVSAQSYARYPVLAPDGRRLRFTVGNWWDTLNHIWEVNIDGTNLHEFLLGWNPQGHMAFGTWTPDGKYYVFQLSQADLTSIWAVREKIGMWERVNSAPVQLTFGPVKCSFATPSLDGRKIYVIGEQNHGGELYRFDLKTRQYVHFLPGLSAEFVAYSDDGEWIAYVSFPEGLLWRSRADGSERLQLTSPPAKVFLPRWSPDGKKIAYFEQPKGGFPFSFAPYELRIISADGTTLEHEPTHGNSGKNAADLHWSPDGKLLIWGEWGGSVKTLDLSTGRISDFPGSEGLNAPRWSQDGRYSVWGSQDSTRLMLLDQTSHRWTELVKMDFILFPTLTRDGKYVYFFNNATLCRVRVTDHKLEELATRKDLELNGSLGVPWLGLTPDGSPIVMRNMRTRDILALDWEAP